MSKNKVELKFTALDNATATIKRIHNRLARMNEPMRKIKSAGGNLFGDGRGLNAAAKSIKGVGDGLLQATRNVAILGGAAYGMYRFAQSANDAFDKLGDLAGKTGGGAKDIMVFGAMVERAGGSVEEAAEAMGKLNKSMSLARSGSQGHIKAFRAVGLTINDLKTMQPAQVLERMADAFAKSNDHGRKLVISQKLMGKSSASMVSVLSDGSQAIRDQIQSMQEDGLLPKNAEEEKAFQARLKRSGEIESSMQRLSNVLLNMKNLLGFHLADALEPFINSFRKWAVANKELIRGEWVKFLKVHLPVIIEGGKTAFKVLGTIVIGVAKAFAWMGNNLGTTGTTMVVLGVVLAPLIASLASLGGLLFSLGMNGFPLIIKAIGALPVVARLASAAFGSLFRLMLANPFVALAAAVVGVGVLIFKNWDAIVSYISGAWDRIKAAFSDGFFSGMFTLWIEGFKAFGNAIIGIVKSVIPDSLMPGWLKNYKIGGGVVTHKATASPATPSAPAAAAAGSMSGASAAAAMSYPGGTLGQSIAGTINVVLSDNRSPRVTVSDGTPGVDFRFYTGRTMAAS